MTSAIRVETRYAGSHQVREESLLLGQQMVEKVSRGPRVLLVKTSSLGDVVMNLPVVNDVMRWRPDAQIDWVVEEAFADIPRLHPCVSNVLVIPQRRIHRRPWSVHVWKEGRKFRAVLRSRTYDCVIDTQGLIKSAAVTSQALGKSIGYEWFSAREPLSALAYDLRISVPKRLHAIERNRRLAAAALGYSLDCPATYGLTRRQDFDLFHNQRYWVAIHGSSRDDKCWSEANWIALGKELGARGLTAVLPWGTADELARSKRLGTQIPGAVTPPRLALPDFAALVGTARLVVGMDTGPTHLAAAMGAPVVALFCASDPLLTGVLGEAPCFNLGTAGSPPSAAAVIVATDHILSQADLAPPDCPVARFPE